MARTLKQDEHAAKRNEILDVAMQLIYSKGYGRMTIQDILERLKISKGAFYHYFGSKTDVLEALVVRMVEQQIQPLLDSIVRDPKLTAIQKLQRYFDTAVQWKTSQKDFMLELVRVWYSDENALARQKMYVQMVAHVKPLFVEIIRQGVREGVFTTPYPEYASQANIDLVQGLGDTFARMVLDEEIKPEEALNETEALVTAYNDVVERILGAPKGSIHLMDTESLKEWFSPDGVPAMQGQAPREKNAAPGPRGS